MKEKLRSDFQDRQNMIDPDYELFYYSDTSLQNVKPHKHGYYEIMFFLEGKVATVISTQSYRLRPGDITIIPPGVFHQSKIDTSAEYRRFVFWISEAFYNILRRESPAFSYLPELVEEQQQFRFHLDSLAFHDLQTCLVKILESSRKKGFGCEAYTGICCSELILRLTQAIHDQQHPVVLKEEQSLFDNLLVYIQTHLEGDLSLDALANTFFVSKYYLSHLFKDHMGMSLHQYVIKKRLENIRVLILQDKDITKACEDMGFKNYSSFYRSFVKEYGMSPKDYRKTFQVTPEQYSQKTAAGYAANAEAK